MSSILCVDDDPATALHAERVLRQLGHEPYLATRVHVALEALRRRRFDLVLASFHLPDGTGLDLLDSIGEAEDPAPVLIMTPHNEAADGTASLDRGALDFLTKPLRSESLRLAVQGAIETVRLRRENAAFRQRIAMMQGPPPIVGQDAGIRRALELIDSAAPTGAAVLVEGETGTGKELFARAIHEKSPRRDRPFVTVHCGALSPVMAETALFGEDPGTFARPGAPEEGAFERADQGTLLLAEIAELDLAVQLRILRALQQQEFERAPGARPVRVDARLIATTRRDLRAEVAAGRFRRDLYYRLSAVTVRVPALRERPDDLPLLVEHFARRAAGELGVPMPGIPAATLDRLRRHDWPGNVHELANAVERAVILSHDGTLSPRDFDLRDAPGARRARGAALRPADYDIETLKREALRRALAATGGRRGEAADLLGISDRTLRNMLKREREPVPKVVRVAGRTRRSAERARRPAAHR